MNGLTAREIRLMRSSNMNPAEWVLDRRTPDALFIRKGDHVVGLIWPKKGRKTK